MVRGKLEVSSPAGRGVHVRVRADREPEEGLRADAEGAGEQVHRPASGGFSRHVLCPFASAQENSLNLAQTARPWGPASDWMPPG